MASGKRPEHRGPPELFYNEKEAKKYTSNSRMIEIQVKMAERALELLNLPEDRQSLILDIGCGSGLSGEALTENNHMWIGLDISVPMLDVALEREVNGDLILSDMGLGVPFAAGSFDGALSVSALQWLCNADKKSHIPVKRLYKFFSSLYSSLCRGSRAVFQLYPENGTQMELITNQALRAGFTGGLVIDYPNSTKAKKMFLCLFTGGAQQLPKSLTTESSHGNNVDYSSTRDRGKRKPERGVAPKKSKQWILEKKERRQKKGLEMRQNSKYTGRKRKGMPW